MKDKTFFQKLLGQISPEAADVSEVKASLETLSAENVELKAALEAAVASVKEADTKIAEFSAQVAALQEQLGAKEQAAADEAKAARMKKLSDVLGDEKASSMFEVTKDMGAEQFEAVVAAMGGTLKAEAELFAPVGVDAVADADAVAAAGEGESLEAKMLRQKYHSTK